MTHVDLTLDWGAITYRRPVATAAERMQVVRAAHEALKALGFEPWVQAHGWQKDEYGALRQHERPAPDREAAAR